jgi:hypothetical protein
MKITPKDMTAANQISDVPEATNNEGGRASQTAAPAGENKPDDQIAAASAQAEDTPAPKTRVPFETASANGWGTQTQGASPFGASNVSDTTAQSQPGSVPVSPASSAEALRNSETETPAPVAPAAPAQEIAVRINRAEQAVEVHVTERAGQVHVAVRTPDAGLQTSLRQDLGTLVRSLDRAGYHAEASAPLSVSSTESPSSQMNGNNSQQQDSGSNSGRQSGGQPGEQQNQRQPKHNAQDWIETMENAQ